MNRVSGLVTTMLMLIGLYLVLRFGTNASKVIGSIGQSSARVFKTLQGR